MAVVAGALMVALSIRPDRSGEAGAVPGATGFEPGQTLIDDALRAQSLWQPTEMPTETASCRFDVALVVRREIEGTFRCRGPLDKMPANLRAEVAVRLLTKDSCAAIWFRFRDNVGYQLRVCERNVYLGVHRNGKITVLKTIPISGEPIELDAEPTRIGLAYTGATFEVTRDVARIGGGTLTDPEITDGQLVLGIFTERDAPKKGPYEVAFTDVKIWAA